MPTWAGTEPFYDDYRKLSAAQRRLFSTAVAKFVADLREGSFRKGLRVKAVRGVTGVYEMTWAPDGRATFEFGPSQSRGPHIVWRRIGTHDIFRNP